MKVDVNESVVRSSKVADVLVAGDERTDNDVNDIVEEEDDTDVSSFVVVVALLSVTGVDDDVEQLSVRLFTERLVDQSVMFPQLPLSESGFLTPSLLSQSTIYEKKPYNRS